MSAFPAHIVTMNTNNQSEAGVAAKTVNQAEAQSQPNAAVAIPPAAGAATPAQGNGTAEILAFLKEGAALGRVAERAGEAFRGDIMAGKPVVEVDSKTVINFTVVPQKFVKPEGEKRFGCTG